MTQTDGPSAMAPTRADREFWIGNEGEGQSEARFTKPRPECPYPERWTSNDDQATEFEVIEGFAGLVRMLQPDYVIETGTHRGFMAKAIGEALQRNGHGHCDSVEMVGELVQKATGRLGNLSSVVTIHHRKTADFTPREPIDLAWLDSHPQGRIEDFVRWYEAGHFHARSVVCFHDSGRQQGPNRDLIVELARRSMVIPIFLPTPRGVAICQVVPK